MQYLNLEIWLTRQAEYLDAEHTDRATWFALLCFCADMENGGLIRDANKWTDRQWGRIGLLTSDVQKDTALWSFECGHLKVWGYPKKQESATKAKRKAAQTSNAKRWGGKLQDEPTSYNAPTE